MDILADRSSAGKGRITYEKNCATCHGMKGDGAEISREFNGKRAFDFTNLSTMANKHPLELFDGVTNGISGKAMPRGRTHFLKANGGTSLNTHGHSSSKITP